MYAKLLSISDELMWRYYRCSPTSRPRQIEAETRAGAAHGVEDGAGARASWPTSTARRRREAAEAEWRRVHQQRAGAVGHAAVARCPPAPLQAARAPGAAGLAPSKSEADAAAAPAGRQAGRRGARAGRRARARWRAQPFVLSVGRRHASYRIEPEASETPARGLTGRARARRIFSVLPERVQRVPVTPVVPTHRRRRPDKEDRKALDRSRRAFDILVEFP